MDDSGFQKLPSAAERKADLEEALRSDNEETPDRWQKAAVVAGLKAEDLFLKILPESDYRLYTIDREFIYSVVGRSPVGSISYQNGVDDGNEWSEHAFCSARKLIPLQKAGSIVVDYRGTHDREAFKEPLKLGPKSPDPEMDRRNITLPTLGKKFKSLLNEKLDCPLEDLKRYLSLFPAGYEFDKYTLVQLWMAEGFLGDEQEDRRMEDIGCEYFDSLLEEGFIVPSGWDHSYNRLKYGVDDAKIGERLILQDDKVGDIPVSVQRLSLLCKTMDLATFESIRRCKNLSTLFLFPGDESCFQCIPRHFFLGLKFLRILNMNGFCVTELPSSIGSLKSLYYLDVSETPIKWLPEAISCIESLQTLKLRYCLDIRELPKETRRLINLRHLVLDIGRQLISMPTGIGYLTKLQSLSAFLVGRRDGCRIGELKNLNNLRGEFCLLRLENVVNSDEAKEAALSDKRYIEKLELQWSELYEKVEEQEEILENLQPHHDVKELKIDCYSGSKFPPWISSAAYVNLVSMSFYKCENCQVLPSIGVLPSLRFLYINAMNGVKEIDTRFFKNGTHQGDYAFPKLERLEIYGMNGLKEWTVMEIGDLPHLLKLTLESCPELVSLPSFSGINSLKHLEIVDCPKLQSLPGLPTSLGFLLVKDCRCNVKGDDWPKVSHVRSIWIDQEEISSESR